jgi:NADPH2:quinone reductase
MKAIFLVRNGDSSSAFEIRETPIPVPGHDEVVIRAEASGLNFADVMARRGLYKAAPPKPAILGYDIAGTIHSVGSGVSGLKKGQRVAAMSRFGGYAEYAVTKAGAVIPLPDGMDAALATSLATQASTAVYSALFASRLYKNEKILIHAAAGGVGTFLVQLAKSAECTVFGSASTSKHGYLKELGVDFPIDSRAENPYDQVTGLIGADKLDVVFDNIGGLSFKRGLAALGHGGRMVSYGAAAQNRGNRSGRLSSLRVGLGFGFHSPIRLIVRSSSIIGVNMLALADHKPAVMEEVMAEVGKLTRAGILKPVLGKSFPASEIAAAHDYLESRQSIGKVAITW